MAHANRTPPHPAVLDGGALVMLERVPTETRRTPLALLALVLDLACVVGFALGTAIALALATEGPFERVVATDVSADALEVARANHASAAPGAPVEFRLGDLYGPVAGERFDVVVSNPPYVGDLEPLPTDVERFEPPEALLAGVDGLDVYRRLVPKLSMGFAALEVGEGQAAAVRALMEFRGFEVEVVKDLAGIDRVVVGRRA